MINRVWFPEFNLLACFIWKILQITRPKEKLKKLDLGYFDAITKSLTIANVNVKIKTWRTDLGKKFGGYENGLMV